MLLPGPDLNLNPSTWGWRVINGMMMPVEMTKPVAPDKLLKIIKCSVKQIVYVLTAHADNMVHIVLKMCGECRGISCLNSEQIVSDEYDIND